MEKASFGDGWEGRVVEGRFPLLKWIGGTENSALYFTVLQGMQEAIIQVILTDDAQAVTDIAQWTFAESLSHPNLSKVFAAGRCAIDGKSLVYVVGERSTTNLAKTIESGRLNAQRAKEIFGPIVDALEYLHTNGVVHGHLNPSNIHFAGSKPRLLLTDLLIAGTVKRSISATGNYDAPELRHGEATAAADTWSLGLTMWEAMSQTPPSWDLWSDDEPEVPASVPTPFRKIVQDCLRLDPLRRCSLADVQERLSRSSDARALDAPSPVTAPLQIPLPIADPIPVEASEARIEERPETHSPVPEKTDTEEAYEGAVFSGMLSHFEETDLPQSRWVPFVLVLLAVIGIGGFFFVREYRAGAFSKLMERVPTTSAPASQKESASASPEATQTEPAQTPPAQTQPAQTQAAPTQPEEAQPAPAQPITGSQEKDKEAAQPPSEPATQADEASQTEAHGAAAAHAPVTEEPVPPRRMHREENGRGQVERRVMPSVSPGARSAMRRPVQVLIRVTVNRQGTVSDASYVSPGRGNYFARQAQKAAESWKFKPPVRNGAAESSVWMLRFNFDRAGTEATATKQ